MLVLRLGLIIFRMHGLVLRVLGMNRFFLRIFCMLGPGMHALRMLGPGMFGFGMLDLWMAGRKRRQGTHGVQEQGKNEPLHGETLARTAGEG